MLSIWNHVTIQHESSSLNEAMHSTQISLRIAQALCDIFVHTYTQNKLHWIGIQLSPSCCWQSNFAYFMLANTVRTASHPPHMEIQRTISVRRRVVTHMACTHISFAGGGRLLKNVHNKTTTVRTTNVSDVFGMHEMREWLIAHTHSKTIPARNQPHHNFDGIYENHHRYSNRCSFPLRPDSSSEQWASVFLSDLLLTSTMYFHELAFGLMVLLC